MLLRAGKFKFVFPRSTLVMGIVNITPDSFSDGGKFFHHHDAVNHSLQLVAEGADIIDVGGESSRPRATPVEENEELRRVIPVIEELAAKISVPISIDTMKPGVAREAIAAGASIVNDIAANRPDAEMWRIVAETGVAYVLMHMQGNPATMQQRPAYENVVAEVAEYFEKRLKLITAAGVHPEQVVLDVGIGFGKTVEHNLQLLRELCSFRKLDRPMLLGVSRKSFLNRLHGTNVSEVLSATLACECWGVQRGVQIIRTHEVAATRHAIAMVEKLLSHGPLGNFKS